MFLAAQVLKKGRSLELGPCTVGMHLAQKVNVEELPGLLARSIYRVLVVSLVLVLVFTWYLHSISEFPFPISHLIILLSISHEIKR